MKEGGVPDLDAKDTDSDDNADDEEAVATGGRLLVSKLYGNGNSSSPGSSVNAGVGDTFNAVMGDKCPRLECWIAAWIAKSVGSGER